MSGRQRFYAGFELILLFLLWFANVWGLWRWTGASVWTTAGFVSLGGIVLTSIKLRKPDWKSAGFRLDNFRPALLHVSLPVLSFAGLFFILIYVGGVPFQAVPVSKAWQTMLSGVVQQAFFLGYLLPRWNVIVANPIGAVVANALAFGLIHLPHVFLTLLTFFGGLFLGALFLRARNVLVLGLTHGLLAVMIVPTLRFIGLVETTQIGAPELSPLAAEVARQWQPGNRVGIGPHGIAPEQLGHRFRVRVESIGHAAAAEEVNRDELVSFFQDRNRVFCFLLEEDLRRYVKPFVNRPAFLLGQRYVWRRKFNLDTDFFQSFLSGSGDIPVLAAFRQQVFLVSNKPTSAD
jgi:membrane protease YdiL (CAAX protease family)